jgi:hypothetical protein
VQDASESAQKVTETRELGAHCACVVEKAIVSAVGPLLSYYLQVLILFVYYPYAVISASPAGDPLSATVVLSTAAGPFPDLDID